jgi:hypothetical protein
MMLYRTVAGRVKGAADGRAREAVSHSGKHTCIRSLLQEAAITIPSTQQQKFPSWIQEKNTMKRSVTLKIIRNGPTASKENRGGRQANFQKILSWW